MTLAVVGSRNFTDKETLYKEVSKICKNNKIDTIVSGGAKGADSLAEEFAKDYNLKLTTYLPDWVKFGKSAGFKRNKDVISNSDMVIAFWDGESLGTKHSIDLAKKLNKPFTIILF